MKFYTCKVCDDECISLPLDGEIYEKEVCSPECLAQLKSQLTPVAADGAKCFVCGQPCGGGALCEKCDTSETPRR